MHTNANTLPMYISLVDDVEETTDVDLWLLTETTLDAQDALYSIAPNALRALEAV